MTTFLQEELVKIRTFLLKYFALEELRTLCFDMGVDYDSLSGDGHEAKCRELVAYVERRSFGYNLLVYLDAQRPKAFLEEKLTQIKERWIQGEEDAHVRGGFVNRRYEIDSICSPSANDCILVDAPAGYGKSHLLLEVKRRFEKQQDWMSIIIKVREEDALNKERILIQIVQQIAPNIPVAECRDLRQCLTHLSGVMQSSHKHLLILVDDAHHLSEDLVGWLLEELAGDIRKYLTAIIHPRLRIIVAGRYMSRGRKRYYDPLVLSPFDEKVLQEAIKARASLIDVLLSEDVVTRIADEILEVSGGHPWCITQILDDMARHSFTMNIDEHFRQSQVQYLSYTSSAIDRIMKRDIEMMNVFGNLCVFRRFECNILDKLQKLGYLPQDIKPIGLLQKLLDTHLISPGGRQEPMYADRLVRRMLSAKMRMEPDSAKRYCELNTIALEVFDNWARGKNSEGEPLNKQFWGRYQIVAALEGLFNYANCPPKILSNDLCHSFLDRVREYLDSFRTSPDGPDVYEQVYEFKERFSNDWELQRVVRRNLGEVCGKYVRELIQNRLSNERARPHDTALL